MLSLTGKNWAVSSRTQDAIRLAAKTVSKIPIDFAQLWLFRIVLRHIHVPCMTSLTCGFPGFVRRFQFNLIWLLNLIIDVRVREQPVLPEQSEVATPTLQSVWEDPRSSTSVPQPLVSNVTTNFIRQVFRPVLCFDTCLLLSHEKKVPHHEYVRSSTSLKKQKNHRFQRLRTRFFRDFACFWHDSARRHKNRAWKNRPVETQLQTIKIVTIFELSWFRV